MKKRQELSCASRERKKSCEEKEELSQSHLITSSGELKAEIFAVDELPESTSRKKNKKIELLRTQIQTRRKVLGQTVPIVFTSRRKQLPLKDIEKELYDYIDQILLFSLARE